MSSETDIACTGVDTSKRLRRAYRITYWVNMDASKSKRDIRRKSNFYEKYANYCRLKIVRPLPLPKKNRQKSFDIFGDGIDAGNWLAIIDALAYDESLVNVAIKLKKAFRVPVASINSLNKLRKIPCQVPITTKILFTGLVRSIAHCLSVSQCLTSLTLEGLPLIGHYTHLLLEGLSQNRSIEHVSFDRSAIGDDGFQAICASVKYLPNIESFSACQCNLTHNSCEALAALITSQCVYRFSEGWMHSLRYRQVDVKSIRGIKRIALNRNESIGDKGVRRIIDALIDDEWIEAVQLRECGLSNSSADLIMAYLKKVGARVTFDVTQNKHLSKYCAEEILATIEDHSNESATLSNKEIIIKLKDENECLRSQLSTEKLNRMRSDELNVQLKSELLKQQNESKADASAIPDGFVLVPKDAMAILQARDKLPQAKQMKVRSKRTKVTKSLYTTQKRVQKVRKSSVPESIGDVEPLKKWKTLSEKSANDARTLFFGSSETPSIDSESNWSDSDLELNQ